MSGERKRNLKGLIELVQSLSGSEKKQVRAHLANQSRGAAEGKYAKLYEKICKGSKVDLAELEKLFHTEKSISDSCDYLVGKVFESLAINEKEGRIEPVIVKKAIEKGFYSLAAKVVKKEVKRAFSSFDLNYLKELYQFKIRLEKYYGQSISFPASIPSYDHVLLEIVAQNRAEWLYRKFKSSVVLSFKERRAIFNAYTTEVQGLGSPSFFPTSQARVLKMKTTWLVLGKEFAEAQKVHEILLNTQRAHPSRFAPEFHTDELFLQFSFLTFEKKYSEAEQMIYELGSTVGNNASLDKKTLGLWIFGAIRLAVLGGKTALGNRAIKELERTSVFESKRMSLLLHSACLICVYNEDWSKVLDLQYRLSRFSKSAYPDIALYAPLVKAIAYFELGELSDSKRESLRFDKATQELNLEYPQFVVECVLGLIEIKNRFGDPKLFIEAAKRKIEDLLQRQDESHFARYFNLSVWLESKRTGEKMDVLIQQGRSPSLMEVKQFS